MRGSGSSITDSPHHGHSESRRIVTAASPSRLHRGHTNSDTVEPIPFALVHARREPPSRGARVVQQLLLRHGRAEFFGLRERGIMRRSGKKMLLALASSWTHVELIDTFGTRNDVLLVPAENACGNPKVVSRFDTLNKSDPYSDCRLRLSRACERVATDGRLRFDKSRAVHHRDVNRLRDERPP